MKTFLAASIAIQMNKTNRLLLANVCRLTLYETKELITVSACERASLR